MSCWNLIEPDDLPKLAQYKLKEFREPMISPFSSSVLHVDS